MHHIRLRPNAGGLIAVLFLVCIALAVRQRRRAGKVAHAAPVEDKQAKSEAAAQPLSTTCAGCGKALKARAVFAGKRVKCPQCGKAVLIPESGAIKASRTPS